MKEKLTAVIKITRPVNFIITFIAVIVAAIICQTNANNRLTILLAAVAASLTTAAGNVINDIYDVKIDRINQPHRPLPSKKISIEAAYILYFSLLVISIFVAVQISMPVFLLVLLSNLLLFLYSVYLKQIPVIGNLTVASLTGLVFIYGGTVVGNPLNAIVPAIFAFLINLIREMVKDIEDVEGDKAAGFSTFPIKFGHSKSKFLISIFSVCLIAFTFYPFIEELYKIEFFIIVMISVNPIMVYILKLIHEKKSERNLRKISILLKLSMILGLIAIYLGA